MFQIIEYTYKKEINFQLLQKSYGLQKLTFFGLRLKNSKQIFFIKMDKKLRKYLE